MSRPAFQDYVKGQGGADSDPLMKINFGVSEPISFLHSHLYIYKKLKSKRTSLYLKISRDEGHSKFGCKLDEHIRNSKIKNLRRQFRRPTFSEGR